MIDNLFSKTRELVFHYSQFIFEGKKKTIIILVLEKSGTFKRDICLSFVGFMIYNSGLIFFNGIDYIV